jgi:hypothetical protein
VKRSLCIAAAVLTLISSTLSAQELIPRAYWPAPVGTTAIVFGARHQWGDVVTDPSLPLVGVDSRINSGVLGFQRTLGLFGRTSNIQLALPYSSGTTKGLVEGEPGRRDVSGFGDISATWSVNILGAPAMTLESFRSFLQDPKPIVAASIKVVAPTGQYDKDRLINIGTNRWATRLRVGYIQPLASRWLLELAIGTWLFEDNDEFLGTTREQKPITAFDVSLIHEIGDGFWASLDGTYYAGGRTRVDGTRNFDFQRNSRLGFSVAYPYRRRHIFKASYTNGLTTESGGDFDSIGLTYVYVLP